MALLTQITRNNSQMLRMPFEPTVRPLGMCALYKHDVCIVHDVLNIEYPSPALPIPSKNHRFIPRARNTFYGALVVVQLVNR